MFRLKEFKLKKIEEHIYELLFTHDCVTLPTFGGFVGQYTSSNFNEKLNSFTPPAKNVSFNKHLKNDDGLLTHDVANFQNISYTEASQAIKQYVLALKTELEENKRVEINKIGTLFIDKENAVKFIASTTNFSTKSYGLPTLKPQLRKIEIKEDVTPIIKLTPIEKKEENSIPIIALNQKTKRSNTWWVAAVLLPILFYSAWIPTKTELFSNTKQFHYSDLNPFTFQKNKKYEKQTITSVEFETLTLKNFYSQTIQKVDLDDSTYLWVNNNEVVVPTALAETTYVEIKEVELVEEIKLNASYHLIGGCFGSKENAENLVNQMNNLGYSARILDKNKGLFRVSIGDFTKRKSAKKAKEKLKSEHETSSWILKK
jgi:nucleoid DNA-binding protein